MTRAEIIRKNTEIIERTKAINNRPCTYTICQMMPEDECWKICPLAEFCGKVTDEEEERLAYEMVMNGDIELY